MTVTGTTTFSINGYYNGKKIGSMTVDEWRKLRDEWIAKHGGTVRLIDGEGKEIDLGV